MVISVEIVGLDVEKIKAISKIKEEDSSILDYRLKSYELFQKLDYPSFGPKADIDFDKVIYYKTRDEDSIKACDELGISMIFTGMRHFKH